MLSAGFQLDRFLVGRIRGWRGRIANLAAAVSGFEEEDSGVVRVARIVRAWRRHGGEGIGEMLSRKQTPVKLLLTMRGGGGRM